MTGRTALLVAIIVATLLIHYFPGVAPIIWVVAAGGAAAWLVRTGLLYYRHHRRLKERAAQARADAAEYHLYERELTALRTDSTLTADAFEQRAALLQERHKAMLVRRFGPH